MALMGNPAMERPNLADLPMDQIMVWCRSMQTILVQYRKVQTLLRCGSLLRLHQAAGVGAADEQDQVIILDFLVLFASAYMHETTIGSLSRQWLTA